MGQKANGEWFIFPLLLVQRGFKALKKMVKLEFQTKDYKNVVVHFKEFLTYIKVVLLIHSFPTFLVRSFQQPQ